MNAEERKASDISADRRVRMEHIGVALEGNADIDVLRQLNLFDNRIVSEVSRHPQNRHQSIDSISNRLGFVRSRARSSSQPIVSGFAPPPPPRESAESLSRGSLISVNTMGMEEEIIIIKPTDNDLNGLGVSRPKIPRKNVSKLNFKIPRTRPNPPPPNRPSLHLPNRPKDKYSKSAPNSPLEHPRSSKSRSHPPKSHHKKMIRGSNKPLPKPPSRTSSTGSLPRSGKHPASSKRTTKPPPRQRSSPHDILTGRVTADFPITQHQPLNLPGADGPCKAYTNPNMRPRPKGPPPSQKKRPVRNNTRPRPPSEKLDKPEKKKTQPPKPDKSEKKTQPSNPITKSIRDRRRTDGVFNTLPRMRPRRQEGLTQDQKNKMAVVSMALRIGKITDLADLKTLDLLDNRLAPENQPDAASDTPCTDQTKSNPGEDPSSDQNKLY